MYVSIATVSAVAPSHHHLLQVMTRTADSMVPDLPAHVECSRALAQPFPLTDVSPNERGHTHFCISAMNLITTAPPVLYNCYACRVAKDKAPMAMVTSYPRLPGTRRRSASSLRPLRLMSVGMVRTPQDIGHGMWYIPERHV